MGEMSGREVNFYVRHIEIRYDGYFETTAATCGGHMYFPLACGIVGALDDRRFVATCSWPVDLYFTAVLVDKETFRGVEVWDGVGRPRPLPVPVEKGWDGLRRKTYFRDFTEVFRSYRRGVGRLSLEVVREAGGYLKVGGRPAWHYVLGVLPDGRWVYLDEELRTYVGEFKPAVEDPLSTYGVVGRVELTPGWWEIEDVRAPLGASYLIACSRDLEEASRRTYEKYGVGYNISDCAPGVIWPIRVRDEALWRALLDWPLADPTPHVIRLWKRELAESDYASLWPICAGDVGGTFYTETFRKVRLGRS